MAFVDALILPPRTSTVPTLWGIIPAMALTPSRSGFSVGEYIHVAGMEERLGKSVRHASVRPPLTVIRLIPSHVPHTPRC